MFPNVPFKRKTPPLNTSRLEINSLSFLDTIEKTSNVFKLGLVSLFGIRKFNLQCVAYSIDFSKEVFTCTNSTL